MGTKEYIKVQANTTPTFTPVLQKPRPLSDSYHHILQRRDHHEPIVQEPGQPVLGTPAFIDPRFGHDFSRVRVYNKGAVPIHPKLRINKPGDVYEEEADRVAEQVMRMEGPGAVPGGESNIRRACPTCEEEELQAKSTSGNISEVNPDLESHIQSLKGGGQPLSENDRAFFEPRFGHDFSQVRVHTDANAARAVNARAFTVGQDVVFGAGQYAPGARGGRRLLAHELTHVVQQETVPKKNIGHELMHVIQKNKGTSKSSIIIQRRSQRGRRGPGVRPIPSIVPPPDVIRNLKNRIQGRGRVRRQRGGSLPPEFESRWERYEAEKIETGVGIHILFINNYQRVSGVSGTVGEAKTPAQAAAGAIEYIMEGAVIVGKIPEYTELLVFLGDLKKAYLPVIDNWKSLLPESEYQLYAIVNTDPVLMYEIPVAITTNKHLAKEILIEMGEPKWYSIKPYGKIWGQVILPALAGPEYPVIKPANE